MPDVSTFSTLFKRTYIPILWLTAHCYITHDTDTLRQGYVGLAAF